MEAECAPVPQTVHNELDGMWKEAVETSFEVLFRHFLPGTGYTQSEQPPASSQVSTPTPPADLAADAVCSSETSVSTYQTQTLNTNCGFRRGTLPGFGVSLGLGTTLKPLLVLY